MARIQSYQNDTTISLDDKVIGTDSTDDSTKNFTIADILSLSTASSRCEVLAAKLVPVSLEQGDVETINIYSTTNDPSTGSIHYNGSVLTNSDGTNILPSADVTVKLSLGAFINALQSNARALFTLYENGLAIGTAQFDYVRDEMHSATFFSYFKLTQGREYSFSITSVNNDFELSAGSFIEFEVIC